MPLHSVNIKAEDFGYLRNKNELFSPQITNSEVLQLFKICTKKSLWIPQNFYCVASIAYVVLEMTAKILLTSEACIYVYCYLKTCAQKFVKICKFFWPF